MRVRQTGVLPRALGPAQYLEIWVCDFSLNALHTNVKRLCLPLWLITWLGWPCNSPDSFTDSLLYVALCLSVCLHLVTILP